MSDERQMQVDGLARVVGYDDPTVDDQAVASMIIASAWFENEMRKASERAHDAALLKVANNLLRLTDVPNPFRASQPETDGTTD